MSTIPELPAGTSPDQPEARSVHDRVTAAVKTHLDEFPRFWSKPRPSVAQQLDYAHRGDYTTDDDGPARRWHLAFTYLVSVPLKAVGAYLDWCGDKPGRFFTVLPITAVLVTAANTLPVFGLLIPDPVTLDYWPPLSWLPWKE